MYPVSNDYSAQMRMPVREAQAHATVFLGVFDRTASQSAEIISPSVVAYSNIDNIIHSSSSFSSYATFEGGGFRLDGRQALLPDNLSAASPQGFISETVSGSTGGFGSAQRLVINFKEYHDMIGLTLGFDPCFPTPTELAITGYNNDALIESLTLTSPIDVSTKANIKLESVNKIILDFKLVYPYGRARLNYIGFGIGYTYSDSELISTTEKHQGSPVSLSLPTSSFEFSLFNRDNVFGVDNNTELAKFLTEGQQVSVTYAVTWPGGKQEIPGGIWFLKSWTVDRFTATFQVENALGQLIDSKYAKGVYDGKRRTLFELAEAVFADAGATNYYIDPHLQTIYTAAPLPIVSHAEALQIIANAGLARVYVDREGAICLQATVESIPEVVSSTAQTYYSSSQSMLNQGNIEYMTFESGFARLDGTQRLLPNKGDVTLSAGWVAQNLSEDNAYPENEITLHYPAPTNVYSLTIEWGGTIPRSANVTCKTDGTWQSPVLITPTRTTENYNVAFEHCTDIKISLIEAANDGVRPRILYVNASKLSGFDLKKPQIYENAKDSVEVKLKNVVTYWILRSASKEISEISRQEITTNSGIVEFPHNLAVNLNVRVEKDGVEVSGVTVTAQHFAYISYISVISEVEQEIDLVITGNLINEAEMPIVSAANENGQNQEIYNPLFDNAEIAQNTADWVRNYYSRRIVCDYGIRGFPELEYGDVIYLENDLSAVVTNLELTYNGAFNGSLRLRR